MHTRKVFAALGLGAVVLTGLCPESAQAQRFRRGSGGSQMYSGGYSQSNYPGWAGGYGQSYYPGGGGYGGCCDYAYGYAPAGYGAGYGRAPMYGQQPPYGYAPQMYQPGYAYGGQPMTTYGPQPMPGYGYGTPPQPMPGSASGYQPPVPMPGAGAAAGGGVLPGQPAATLTVNVNDDVFDSKSITVQPGTMVTWVNRGQRPHTVSFPDVNRDSGEVPPGGIFQAIFPTAGTYNYHCRLHPNMTGTVVVGPIAGGTGSTTGGIDSTTGGTGTTTGTTNNK